MKETQCDSYRRNARGPLHLGQDHGAPATSSRNSKWNARESMPSLYSLSGQTKVTRWARKISLSQQIYLKRRTGACLLLMRAATKQVQPQSMCHVGCAPIAKGLRKIFSEVSPRCRNRSMGGVKSRADGYGDLRDLRDLRDRRYSLGITTEDVLRPSPCMRLTECKKTVLY